jgi:hypothetical protein
MIGLAKALPKLRSFGLMSVGNVVRPFILILRLTIHSGTEGNRGTFNIS